MSASKKRLWGISFIVALIVVWQLAAVLINKSFLLPSPSGVLVNIWKNRVELFTVHFPATMQSVIIGLIISVAVGILFAVIMDADERVEKAIYPILTVSQTIPTMCIAPVLVLWFGYSLTTRVIVVVLVNFFSVAVNVFDGFKSVSTQKTELMSTFNAKKTQQLFMLKFPTAMPNLFTALKIAVPWSMVGAAVAEWLGAPSGLGTYSRSMMAQLDAAGLLAPLVILTVTALAANAVLIIIEKKIVTWRE